MVIIQIPSVGRSDSYIFLPQVFLKQKEGIVHRTILPMFFTVCWSEWLRKEYSGSAR